MKKKIIVILIIVGILAVLFTPIPSGVYKDGGTRVYSALTYKIVDWNKLTGENTCYSKTHVYIFPENFKSIDDLWLDEERNVEYAFKATVLEVDDNSALVDVIPNEIDFPNEGTIILHTNDLEKIDVKVGSVVKIKFKGEVMYSYPAQINASSWEIIE